MALTDESSSDLDSMGRVPYLGANLVEETFRPGKNVCHFSQVDISYVASL